MLQYYSDNIPILDFDPWTNSVFDDPSAFHEAARDLAPITKLPDHDVFVMGRYEDLVTVLRDWQNFGNSGGAGYKNLRKGERTFRTPTLLGEVDPPEHTPRRALVARILSPVVLNRFRSIVERGAAETIDRIVDLGEVDAMRDVAEPYIVEVFPNVVGLSHEEREILLPYGNLVFNSFGPENDIYLESARDADKLSAWITNRCRRESLAPGFLGEMIYQGVDRGEISAEEAPLLVRSMLGAGLDSTIYGIANCLLCFAQWPSEWDKLRADPSKVRAAVDEALRMKGPIRSIYRTNNVEIDYKGAVLPVDSKIMLLLHAANHDPRHWKDPGTLDIDRRPNGHLSFGIGIHGCIGQMVSKMEMEILFRMLAERVERIELVSDPKPIRQNSLNSFESVPIRLISKRS